MIKTIVFITIIWGINFQTKQADTPTFMSLSQKEYNNETILIQSQLDFRQQQLVITNCKLIFQKGGSLCNAVLSGKNNTITSEKENIFANVIFSSEFLIHPYLSSWWLSKDSLQNQNYNNLKIQEIFNSIPNHAELKFDLTGHILCDPVFQLNDRNDIKIDFNGLHLYTNRSHGPGSEFLQIFRSRHIFINQLNITGDTQFHTAEDKGEWGMGIMIRSSYNVKLQNVKIEQCWGDNLYISGDKNGTNPSQNIHLEGCILKNGRRNNISIINADSIGITSCYITKTTDLPAEIRTTRPNTAIDLEPNFPDREKVSDFFISDTHIELNHVGTIGIYNFNNLSGKNASIENCTFSNIKYSIYFTAFKELLIKECVFSDSQTPVYLNKVRSISVIDNKLYRDTDATRTISFYTFGDYTPEMYNCSDYKVQNNKILYNKQ